MRIASLVPSSTEMLFALGLGDSVVGVTHECDYPLGVGQLPHLTRSVIPEGLDPGEIDRAVRERTGEGEALYTLDEDTLDELDRVPAVGTMVAPPADVAREEAGRDGRPEEERGPGRRIVIAALALLLLALACGFVVWGLWRSHFVGVEPDGHVAVYQGVPWNVVGDVHLYRTVYVSPLLAAQLSRNERRKLFDHSLRSEDSALDAVHRYEQEIGK